MDGHNLDKIVAALGDRVLINEPMSLHTSFRIGGPADLFVTVESIAELSGTVASAREQEVLYFLLGGGTNILVSDKGIRGLVIENRADEARFEDPCGETILYAESGASLNRLAQQSIRRSLAGLEWAVGIPGTIGGAIVGNAGAYGSSIADVLLRITVSDEEGVIGPLPAEELGFGYRTSKLREQKAGSSQQAVVLSAELALTYEPQRWLERKVAPRMAQRKATQPSQPSAGSVFKNPTGDYAGRLIEAVGLKGYQVGGAQFSPQHANFIVNLGEAGAADVKALIDLAQEQVRERFGTELELEIELVGEWNG